MCRNERNFNDVMMTFYKSMLWNMRYQNLRILHAFARHYSNAKMNFSKPLIKVFGQRNDLCNNNNQTCFSDTLTSARPLGVVKGIYFVIYGIISEFTDKGQFQYLTNLKGPQEGTYLYTTQFLSLR